MRKPESDISEPSIANPRWPQKAVVNPDFSGQHQVNISIFNGIDRTPLPAEPHGIGHPCRVRRRATRGRSQNRRAAGASWRAWMGALGRLGHDLQRPKSVSVLWAVSEGHDRELIEQAHRSAVPAATAHLEGGPSNPLQRPCVHRRADRRRPFDEAVDIPQRGL
jgi:hypothetical protein